MKRQISISFFLGIIVIVLALCYIKVNNENKSNELDITTEQYESETNDASITISGKYISYHFYAKDDNGKLTIYDVKTQSIYMETSIITSMLPMDLQEQLESGIFFKTEAELYDFLESYSS